MIKFYINVILIKVKEEVKRLAPKVECNSPG